MGIIELLALVLLLSWVGGFAFDIAGSFIHILLVLAVGVFLLRFLRSAA